jgi:hypothetical protein
MDNFLYEESAAGISSFVHIIPLKGKASLLFMNEARLHYAS